mgnify:FL=1
MHDTKQTWPTANKTKYKSDILSFQHDTSSTLLQAYHNTIPSLCLKLHEEVSPMSHILFIYVRIHCHCFFVSSIKSHTYHFPLNENISKCMFQNMQKNNYIVYSKILVRPVLAVNHISTNRKIEG